MKKLIALGLIISICLCGCAGMQESQQQATSAEVTTTQFTQPITEKQNFASKEEIPQEPEQKFVQPLLAMLPKDEIIWAPTEAELVQAHKEMEVYELAMYLTMRPWANLIVEDDDYLDEPIERLTFAWQLAERDPAVPKDYGAYSLEEEIYCRYYFDLFDQEADLSLFDGLKTSNAEFKRDNGRIYATYFGGIQDVPPVLKSPMLQYNEEDDVYRLSMALLYEQELYTGDNSLQYYLPCGDYWKYADAEITDYPYSCCLGLLVFELKEKDDHFYILSAKMESLRNYPEDLPLESLLFEELQIPDSTRMEKIARHLENYYNESIQSLLLNKEWQIQVQTNHDYLDSDESKAKFAWFQILYGQRNSDFDVLWDETPEGIEVTGAAAVDQESFLRCYLELFGEEPNWDELQGQSLYPGISMTIQDGYVYGGFPSGLNSYFSFRNTSVSYSDSEYECVVSAEMYDKSNSEILYGTIEIEIETRENGHYLRSIVFRSE